MFLLPLLIAITGCSSGSGRKDVVGVRGDPALAAARQKAQVGLPKFILRLQHPVPGERFAAQVAFKETAVTEYMWADHLTYDGKNFIGALVDTPALLKALSKGQTVSFKKSQVSDWMIRSGDHVDGGFALQVLQERR